MRNREPARRTPASRRVGATPATGPLSATPRACRPYRAQTKGKVERPVRYLRGNFVYGRTFLHDADLDAQRQRWLDRVANIRVHGTTGAHPLKRAGTARDKRQRANLGAVVPLELNERLGVGAEGQIPEEVRFARLQRSPHPPPAQVDDRLRG